ncbi:class I SAM-dependent RNA methyltransferase [Syntrophomonas palmitatica]|uniref:class I SAM-dependent RNA methyltransferase n=1 Tax=Syntrophomonas palmitatica TaxID=402877 RepID=UPI0006CFB12C|nr:class I SAM-dependent RNA methyltransferase [Syntrophomonas palmitatica]
MQCTIAGINHAGEGVARNEGKVVFVPYALPGEQVEVEIVEDKARFARAELMEILQASPHRVEPPCPYYYDCGGCDYQHVDYEEQLKLKRTVVQDALRRIGGIDIEVKPVIGASHVFRYRNKVNWQVKDNRLGFYKSESHDFIEIKDCLLVSETMRKLGQNALPLLNSVGFSEHGQVIIREAAHGQLMMVLTGLKKEPARSIFSSLCELESSVFVEYGSGIKHICGPAYLEENSQGLIFHIGPQDFQQVNYEQNQKLIKLVESYLDLRGDEILLDGYCGLGNIALHLAKQVRLVLGIDIFRPAIDHAKDNAERNRITNCEFMAGKCEEILPRLTRKLGSPSGFLLVAGKNDKAESESDVHFDGVVLDPPRAGCQKAVIDAVAAMQPSRIIYVSCNPATLARDLAIFKSHDYQTSIVQPLDMFPQTSHVECVVLISRVE